MKYTNTDKISQMVGLIALNGLNMTPITAELKKIRGNSYFAKDYGAY